MHRHAPPRRAFTTGSESDSSDELSSLEEGGGGAFFLAGSCVSAKGVSNCVLMGHSLPLLARSDHSPSSPYTAQRRAEWWRAAGDAW